MRVVVFTEHNARIFTNPSNEDYKRLGPFVADPDLSEVRGLPPHHWHLVEGKVKPLAPHVRKTRDEHHAKAARPQQQNRPLVYVEPTAPKNITSVRSYLPYLAVALLLELILRRVFHV